jgi:hypothetical protein
MRSVNSRFESPLMLKTEPRSRSVRQRKSKVKKNKVYGACLHDTENVCKRSEFRECGKE